MKRMPTCKAVTRMVLEGEDRPLGVGERIMVRAHGLICKGCRNFAQQVSLMRKAAARWRDGSNFS